MVAKRGKLKSCNVAAMLLSRDEGKTLAKEHPEIADEWRGGKTYEQIASKYVPGILEKTGKQVVHYAMKKLVPKKERAMINHLRNQQIARKNSSASLANNKREGLGIFGLSKQQRMAIGSEAGKLGTYAKGLVPYEAAVATTEFGQMNEKQYILKLKSLKVYTVRLIVIHANALFGNNRTPGAIETLLCRC